MIEKNPEIYLCVNYVSFIFPIFYCNFQNVSNYIKRVQVI